MRYLKKTISALLFITAFTATLTVANTFRINRVADTVETFEPVIIECVQMAEVTNEVAAEEGTFLAEDNTFVIQDVPSDIKVQPPRIDCRLDDETQQMILERCEELNLDFPFVMAVIFKESSFRPNADSGSSVGLMQINRMNHDWLSKELDISNFFDPEQNVKAGTYILKGLFDKYEDPAKVLMCYNMGESGAKRLWKKGIYMSKYAEGVLQQTEIYKQEIKERMGENDQM